MAATEGLWDGDVLLYKIGFAHQTTGVDGKPIDIKPLSFALHSTKVLIEKWQNFYNLEKMRIFFSCSLKDNFRYKLYSKYKHRRQSKPRPFYYHDIKTYILRKYNGEIVQDGEADDALGIFSTEDTIIFSSDKDLLQIPGDHHDLDFGTSYKTKHGKTIFRKKYLKDGHIRVDDPGILFYYDKFNSKGEKKGGDLIGTGQRWFFAQMLLGDSTDDIPGIKSYGPAKVYKLLKDVDSLDEIKEIVYNIWKEKGDMELYEIVAQLLWIKRSVDSFPPILTN